MSTQPNAEPDKARRMDEIRYRAPSSEKMRESNFVGQFGQRKGVGVNETIKTIKKDELLRYLLAGYKVREVAQMLRVTPPTLRRYIKEDSFQAELKSLSMEIWTRVDSEMQSSRMTTTQRLTEMSETALERINELMDSKDERIVLHAANSVLDRSPETSKHHKVENTEVKIVVDPAQLALAARTAQELETGMVIEGK